MFSSGESITQIVSTAMPQDSANAFAAVKDFRVGRSKMPSLWQLMITEISIFPKGSPFFVGVMLSI